SSVISWVVWWLRWNGSRSWSGVFELGDILLQAAHASLDLLEGVEGTLQASHPASQGGALDLQPGAERLEALPPLAGGVGGRRVGAGPLFRHVEGSPYPWLGRGEKVVASSASRQSWRGSVRRGTA